MKNTIELKDIVAEDFCNYKKPSMFLITCFCDWKCCKENPSICQNNPLYSKENKIYDINHICDFYLNNDISKAIIFGGLEPFLQYDEICEFVKVFRNKSKDDIVIYTGYTEEEVKSLYPKILDFENITIKFGRFIPHQKQRLDETLMVNLASPNQYAKKFN